MAVRQPTAYRASLPMKEWLRRQREEDGLEGFASREDLRDALKTFTDAGGWNKVSQWFGGRPFMQEWRAYSAGWRRTTY